MNYKHKIAPWSNMTRLVFLAGLIVMALMLANRYCFCRRPAGCLDQNYNGTVTEKVRAAINVRSSRLADNSTAIERTEFISFCDDILSEYNKEEDDTVAGTVIFALSKVMSEETISYIVASDKIDRVTKAYCVEQNYRVLKSMLREDVPKEKLDIVIEAMRIFPLVDLAEPLQEVMSVQLRQRSVQAEKLAKELQEVLNLIEESGIAACDRY